MDEKLEKSLTFSKYKETLNNQISQLKFKTEYLLRISINGGTFTIDRSLISFTKTLIDSEITETIMLDNNDIPILINDLESFYDEIKSRYFEVINDYYSEYEKLRKARSVESILDLNI